MRLASVVACAAVVSSFAQAPQPPDAAQIRAGAFEIMTAARYGS
jgi:hypothetical protein